MRCTWSQFGPGNWQCVQVGLRFGMSVVFLNKVCTVRMQCACCVQCHKAPKQHPSRSLRINKKHPSPTRNSQETSKCHQKLTANIQRPLGVDSKHPEASKKYWEPSTSL